MFNYEDSGSLKIDSFIVDNSHPVSAADLTAVVSSGGTVQSITVNDGGSGYVGSTTSVSISPPVTNTGVGLTPADYTLLGIGITYFATAEATITNGSISVVDVLEPGVGYTTTPSVIAPLPVNPNETITDINNIQGFSGIITGISTTVGTSGNPLAIKFSLEAIEKDGIFGNFNTLSDGYPVYIFDTVTGSGVTSIESGDDAIIGIGTTCLNNIYVGIITNKNGSTKADLIANIHSDSNTNGIGITGLGSGKFSWGRLYNANRSANPISIGVTGKTVSSGLSTYPSIQRRSVGLRNTGAINK